MLRSIFLLSAIFLSLATALAQPYEIRVTIDGLRDSSVYFGYRSEDKSYVVDTAVLDKKGSATLRKNKALKKGVYFLVTPDKNYFEMLITDNQKFSVSAKYSDLFGSLKFKGSPENQQFYDYQQYLRRERQRIEGIRQQKKQNEAGAKDSAAIYQQQIDDVERSIDRYIKALAAKNAGSFLGTLLTAMLPVEPPAFDVPEAVANKDSVRQLRAYEYRRDHYFDNFNLADNGLIRTPFFGENIDFFFQKVIPPAADVIIKYADTLIARARADDEMFQYVTEHLFQRYQKSDYMGHDAVVVHLADRYYLSGLAKWATGKYKSDIKDRVDRMRHTLIGNTAPELLLPTHENAYVSLLKTPAEYTILCFWEPNCGHCKKELPRLWTLYEKYRDRGLVVFTVYTQYKRPEWDAYIAYHPYDWIYAWDGVEATNNEGKPVTFSIGSNFRTFYDIRSTPTVFLLDKNKKVIAKRMSVEVLEKILDEEMKRKE